MSEIKCPLCNKLCISLKSISSHIRMSHKKIAKDILFESNIELFRNCNYCNKKIKQYKSDSQSRKCCDKECYRLSKIGKKQDKEIVIKRIKNTNQIEKEIKRKETFIKRYGSLYAPKNEFSRNNKISEKLKGVSHTKEHHIKVIKSKKDNGTLNHTVETKLKISKSLIKTFSDVNFDKSKFLNNNKGYNQGYHKEIYCRSSYEKKFVDFCKKYNIKIQSAENNKFAVNYEDEEGRIRKYFPDFYLPDQDVVIEIKPLGMYDFKFNLKKFSAAAENYNFVVITEEDYLLDENYWDILYENINYA